MLVDVMLEIQVPDAYGEVWIQTRHRRFGPPVDEAEVESWRQAVRSEIPGGEVVAEHRRTLPVPAGRAELCISSTVSTGAGG